LSRLQQYKKLLINLLPKGRLWKPKDQPVFSKYLESAAQEPNRVDGRIEDMKTELDPRNAFETLDQWESALGLPDECTPEDQDLNERRNQITQKLTNVGGLSKLFYEENNRNLGFETVVENRVNFLAGRSKAGDPISNYFNRHFVAGSLAGTFLTEIGWRYYFNVELPATAAEHFVAGSVAGTPLREFSNDLIECTMRKLKPANSGVVFTFV
jgi:uncharacterized protein YmfQ (DUF2313 family)